MKSLTVLVCVFGLGLSRPDTTGGLRVGRAAQLRSARLRPSLISRPAPLSVGGPRSSLPLNTVFSKGPGAVAASRGRVVSSGPVISNRAFSGPGGVVSGGRLVSGPSRLASSGPVLSGPSKVVPGTGRVISGPGRIVSGPGSVVTGLSGPGRIVSGPGSVVTGLSGPGRIVSGPGSVVTGLSGPGRIVSGPGRVAPGPGLNRLVSTGPGLGVSAGPALGVSAGPVVSPVPVTRVVSPGPVAAVGPAIQAGPVGPVTSVAGPALAPAAQGPLTAVSSALPHPASHNVGPGALQEPRAGKSLFRGDSAPLLHNSVHNTISSAPSIVHSTVHSAPVVTEVHHDGGYDEKPDPFTFEYGVHDDTYYTDFSEVRSGDEYGNIVGEYQVALPDGRIQYVKYTADANYGGTVMEVSYKGEARHPEHTGHVSPVIQGGL